jgi:ketosteroid isomerase-like protein
VIARSVNGVKIDRDTFIAMSAPGTRRGGTAVFAAATLLMWLTALAACAPLPRQSSRNAAPPAPAQAAPRTAADVAQLAAQVADTERAFARSMATRDFAAFTAHLSADAVFDPGARTLHGRNAVAAAWKKWFEGPQAPFSWEPDHVEVLDSGDLALTTGPVHGQDGALIGRFNSIWRLEAPGTWRIVFDKGEDVCRCGTSP